MRKFFVFTIFFFCLSFFLSAQYNIVTIAGKCKIYTAPGDGGPATGATLYSPYGVAVDSIGNVYIDDSQNNRVRKINTNGIITTIAGNGTLAYSGDGGPATAAETYAPNSVAADNKGNVYIGEGSNSRIRIINSSGIINTYAGNGSPGYFGDGGPAAAAEFNGTPGICLDRKGNLFIADNGNNRIRMVNTNGIVTTIAGNGTYNYSGDGGPATAAELKNPTGVAADTIGNIYIVDQEDNRIRKIDTFGTITTYGGNGYYSGGYGGYTGDGGPATAAELNIPFGVTTDRIGNVYISDRYNVRIREINSSGIISTVGGTGYGSPFGGGLSGDGGPATAAELNQPCGIAASMSGVYIADDNNERIRLINPSGIISTVAGGGGPSPGGFSGDGGPSTAAELTGPADVCFDNAGNIYISDQFNDRIRKINTNGIISTVAGNGTVGHSGDGGHATSAELYNPYGVSVDKSGNIFIADYLNNKVREVKTNGFIYDFAGTGAGNYSGDGGPATAATLDWIGDVAIDSMENVYIVDVLNLCVRKVNSSGIISTFAGNPYVQGYSGDGGPATAAEMYYPSGVWVDNKQNVFIADNYNNVIRMVNTVGIISTVAGNNYNPGPDLGGYSGDGGPATNAELGNPSAVAVDDSGNIFIADYLNSRIRMVNTGGIITTIAGNGIAGFTGDGLATAEELNYPWGVAVSHNGEIIIGDYSNNLVRKLTTLTSGIIQVKATKEYCIVFPNPSNGLFTVEVEGEGLRTRSVLEIYNMLGEKIYAASFNASSTQINLNNNANGVYFYRVLNEAGNLAGEGKLIISK